MITSYTSKDLIDFETDIGECFKQKMIRAPIHLYYGNEEKMIEIFQSIRPQDWIFCTWRSHYQCLLKGVPPERLKKDIIAGRSIALCYPEYKIFSSAIVTGNIPIATGVAFDIKRKNLDDKVYCFLGDMTSETGCFHENVKYASSYRLPINWIIEDNGKSVCTDTKATWNTIRLYNDVNRLPNVSYYKYTSIYPHAGPGGSRIVF